MAAHYAERRFNMNKKLEVNAQFYLQQALHPCKPVQDFYNLSSHNSPSQTASTPDSVLTLRETPPLDTTPPPPSDKAQSSPLPSSHDSEYHHVLVHSPHGWNNEFSDDYFTMVYDETSQEMCLSTHHMHSHLFKDHFVWENGAMNDGMASASIEEESKVQDNADDMLMSDDREGDMQGEMKPERQALVRPCSVEAELRNYIKDCLHKQLQEEMALCGCDCMTEKEKDDEGGTCYSQDHNLKCKMRRDYGLWAMQMKEKVNSNEGLNLVQRLLACAEAVACRDGRQAQSLLFSVRELASPYGDSLQRVAFCFMEGLAARLDQNTVAGSPSSAQAIPLPEAHKKNNESLSRLFHPIAAPEGQKRHKAFLLMCELCPYIPFGHFFANSMILDAFENEETVHVIDLGMENGLQWPALIRGLGSRPGGPPRLLRITSIGVHSAQMEEIVEVLHHEAALASVNLEFNAVQHPIESIGTAPLGLRAGEAIAINSILQLHCVVKESRGSLNTVLQAIHGLSPKVVTLVEQDANHNGPFFLGRFMEALHYYSAIFDSLQIAYPEQYNTRRVIIEQGYLAYQIRNIVACEGPTRTERHERVDQWRRRMSRAGFQLAPNRLERQAQLWLATYYERHADDYTLSDEKGCLVLGWKGKPIIAASGWRC